MHASRCLSKFGNGWHMTPCGAVSLSGDDSALPEEERAMLDRARALIPRLAGRAPAAAAARRLPDETIAEYREAGILRILQPRRFGGLQGRFSLFSRIVEEFSFGCASSAWVYAVLAEHQWIIAQYPEQAQIDVWSENPEAVASSSLAPRAAAKRTAGGWRLSGRYPFSSGCDCAVGNHWRLSRAGRRPALRRLSAGAAFRGRDRR
jgi:alkylation response protein AidB-like acyl-CoA dehydrogenase